MINLIHSFTTLFSLYLSLPIISTTYITPHSLSTYIAQGIYGLWESTNLFSYVNISCMVVIFKGGGI